MVNQFLLYLTLTLTNTETGDTKTIDCTVVVHDQNDQFVEYGIETEGGNYSGFFDALVFKIERESNGENKEPKNKHLGN